MIAALLVFGPTPVLINFEPTCTGTPPGWGSIPTGAIACTPHSPSSAATFGSIGVGGSTFLASIPQVVTANVSVVHPISPTSIGADISVSNTTTIPNGTFASYGFSCTNGVISLDLDGTSASTYDATWTVGGIVWIWPGLLPGRWYRHTLCIESDNTDVFVTAAMVDEYDPTTGALLNSTTQPIFPPFLLVGFTPMDEFIEFRIANTPASPATGIDNIMIEEKTCYADCDGNGTLNVFDYVCFGDNFVMQTPYANCDGNTVFNIFDYICFGNEFAAGCS